MVAVSRPKLARSYPLNAPGIPYAGPDFLREAEGHDGIVVVRPKKSDSRNKYQPSPKLTALYARALREPGFTLGVKSGPAKYEPVTFIPGHIWGQHASQWMESRYNLKIEPPKVDGPHPADVMILGKMPWVEETQELRNLVGPSGEILTTFIEELRIKGARDWYITNLVKFMPPGGATRLRADWIADCKPLLHQELRIVRPKYILCLGADASKELLGKKFNVSYMEGRVVPYKFPVHRHEDDEPEWHHCQVMTVMHPVEAAREQTKSRIVERGISRFSLLLQGVNFDKAEDDLDHRVIDKYEDAVKWVAEVNRYFAKVPLKDRLVAWDAEWEGQHPQNLGSYLRTVQASWAPKHAVCFKIAHVGGKTAFRDKHGKPAVKRLMSLLQSFCRDKRAIGHFLVADLEWLTYHDFDPTRDCRAPLDPTPNGKSAWRRLRSGEGWLDTAMMAHSIEETAPLGLESLAMRYTTVPRYDIPLDDWKKKYCTERGISQAALEGYGNCPDEILHPYALYDADATLRLARELLPYLDCDYEGNCCWESCWEKMTVQPVILTIHKNGIKVDRKKIDELSVAFLEARTALEDEIREWAAWPNFNIRSVQHVREFLFGTKLNGKFDKNGRNVQIRPRGAKSLEVEPLLDTSKPPRRWAEIRAKGQEREANPTTGKAVLSILMQDNSRWSDQIGWLRDYRFTDQVLKSILRPPVEENGLPIIGDDGFYEYVAGLHVCIDVDGRVRTHLSPTAETGRWKSFRPNLQNLSKSRDPDYKRILGAAYRNKLRSIFIAEEGYALVEFDYKGAELYGMALMSGDRTMIDHAQRALLPDSGFDDQGKPDRKGKNPHPNYYDIHSNVAVLAFQIIVSNHVPNEDTPDKPFYKKTAAEILNLPVGTKCPATKFGLWCVGKTHFRTLAKNVIFGIAYGRGAKAIALQAKEQKVEVTPDEAQIVIDAIFSLYPGLVPFFAEAKRRALQEKWLCHCFGSFRRFIRTSDMKLEGEFERQAMNFPIQGMIAAAVNRGLARMHAVIEEYGLQDEVRMLLQIHDAGLLEVRYDLISWVIEKLIPYAMQDCVAIFPTTLDGEPTGEGPFHLGIDIAVEKEWGGKKLPFDVCVKYGIDPEKYAEPEVKAA